MKILVADDDPVSLKLLEARGKTGSLIDTAGDLEVAERDARSVPNVR